MKKWILSLGILLLILSTVAVSASGHSEKSVSRKPPHHHRDIQLGIDRLLNEKKDLLKGKRVGLITNPTGVNQKLESDVDLLFHDPDIKLVALYGPEHGVRGSAQAGEQVDKYIDEETGLPVYSLYGDTKKPTPEMLKNVDALVFDIQDVGTRYYTYISTMAYAMQAAHENHIPFIVLDRPNPIGGTHVEGPVLDPKYASFVGLYPIPIRHGMTVGELAGYLNKEYHINADLTVVKMKGWKREMSYSDTNLSWVMPSPNMPAEDTALVYPGTGLLEGTNISEGRGTTRPFELMGAPFINGLKLAQHLNDLHLPGVIFRDASFTPTFSKYSGQLVHGVQIHVIDKQTYEPVITGLSIIKTIHDMYPDKFQFSAEDKNGISQFDRLVGNGWIRKDINAGVSIQSMEKKWQPASKQFEKKRKKYLLYK
ncbi:exo-beta-N-acetylmuramidase NamZ domain-containing protein [Scopulibacillus cellulosilyticus]|uniref:Exo-beta-N-acetylmuramidase NamZ domain-containing protein n=1 Tax=Scopulibacillus cellulosilyticus TaxID=2665665 RepID=A0ABW2PX49_9BACL